MLIQQGKHTSLSIDLQASKELSSIYSFKVHETEKETE